MFLQIRKNSVRLLLAAAIGLCLTVGTYLTTLAADRFSPTHVSTAPPSPGDFIQTVPQGFGNPENMWAWGMVWWREHLYVGTSRNFNCADTLAQARNSFGIVIYPPSDPDLNCPEDPLAIDMRAEIWRYTPTTDYWERIYQSPVATVNKYTALGGSITDPVIVTIPISPTNVAVDLGYRGMVVFTEPDGTEALYVTAISTGFVGYDVGAPRILRSTDGVNFAPLPRDPGTVLGSYDKTSMRNPIVHTGSDGVPRLYVQGGSSRGAGEVFEATDPVGGNDNFRQISPEDMNVSAMGSFNGYLYLGTHDRTNGFSLFKMDVDGGPLPYSYTTIMEDGGYLPAELKPNNELLSMTPYDGALYIGGNGVRFNQFGADNVPAELFRLYPNDSWDVVVGLERADTPDGPKVPLSGLGPGFGNDYNGHMWRMSVYKGDLYVSTLDTDYIFKDDNPPPDIIAKMGFDLWRSEDGITFTPVTTDGFRANIIDPGFPRPDLHVGAFDIGGRTQYVTPNGLFLGTVNPFRGLRIWQTQLPPDSVSLSGPGNLAGNTVYTFTAQAAPLTATVPFTYTWSATDLPETIVHQNTLSDTVGLSWNSAGVKTVAVSITNRLGVVRGASFDVNVVAAVANTAPTNIEIAGISLGYFHQPYTFSADILPLNVTQPVQYTWTATDQSPQSSSGGVNSQATFTWNTPGTKTITVTADNGVGLVSASRTVDILDCQPITTATITRQPTGDVYTDATTLFQAQTGGGTVPYHYAWALNGTAVGEDSSQLLLVDAPAGIQTLSLTVSNACGQQEAAQTFLVYTGLSNQLELSTSSALATPANVAPGALLTFTVLLRNTDTPLIAALLNPIPAHTAYVPDSATISHGEVLLTDQGLIWSGKLRPGSTVILRFQVVVDAAPMPAGTPIINQTFIGSDISRYDQIITTAAVYDPDSRLRINNDTHFTNVPTVTLRYAWDEGSDIAYVKFSNDAGFGNGAEANTTPWLPVDPGDPTVSDWSLPLTPPAFIPRTVYAKFSNDSGLEYAPLVTAHIIYDAAPPEITNISVSELSAPASALVLLRITAHDDTSGVASLDVSGDPDFGVFFTVPATGDRTVVAWDLADGVNIYVRARDGAGNLSEVGMGSAVAVGQVAISGPAAGTVNTLYSFTANVQPLTTTLPVTYTWQTTGQPLVTQVGELSSTVSYNWITPGVKTIMVTAQNLLATVTDSYTITIQAPDIVVAPTSLAQTLTSGENDTQSLTIDNVGGGTLNWSLGEIPPTAWLSGTPTSGSISGVGSQIVTVTFDAGILSAGTYNSTFRIQSNDPGQTILDIPVVLTVLPKGPIIAISPDSLPLSVTTGQSTNETLTVSNIGDENLTWSVTADPDVDWLEADVAGGVILPAQSQALNITVDAAALTPGSYSTTLHIDSNDGDQPTVDVPVTLTVLPVGPVLTWEPATLVATVVSGDATALTLLLGNAGDQALTWNLAESPTVSWLSLNATGGTITDGGETSVQVTFDGSGLAANSYATTLVLTSNDPQASSVSIPVTFSVLPTPADVNVSSTTISATLARGQSSEQTLTIQNAGGTELSWSLNPVGTISWLTIVPDSGTVGANESVEVALGLNAGTLAPNTYTATIRLISNDPDQPSIDLQITLTVTSGYYEVFVPVIQR